MSARTLMFAVLLAAPLGLAFACSTPPADGRFVETVPDRPSFDPVADMLVHTCGTLDCHGTPSRNLRLYGREGLRLDQDASPNLLDGSHTTTAEYDEDYQSVVGLEPEQMSQVVSQAGAAPERLTLVRKGRGQEAHKGGSPYAVGDDRDRCLLSWLAKNVDTQACARAVDVTIYP
jgi:hypothetical protein